MRRSRLENTFDFLTLSSPDGTEYWVIPIKPGTNLDAVKGSIFSVARNVFQWETKATKSTELTLAPGIVVPLLYVQGKLGAWAGPLSPHIY